MHHARLQNRLTAPSTALAIGLAAAIALTLLPARWTGPAKGAAATLLLPGQVGMLYLRRHGSRLIGRAKTHFHTADKLAQSERRLRQLEQENRRLATELLLAQNLSQAPSQHAAADGAESLLTTRCVNARVLGRQARTFLAMHHMLDVGFRSGVQSDALVVRPAVGGMCGGRTLPSRRGGAPSCPTDGSPPELIDQGSNAALKADQLVLSQGRIWGKIVEVGPYTSAVRTVTEPGYRDLVQLGHPGPQGILEGTGQRLARIRLIEVTEPVAVGDAVYTAAYKGLLPEPLLYGHVVRLQRPVGAAHWEIWMQPAVAPGQPERVAVLRTELNPLRIASQQ